MRNMMGLRNFYKFLMIGMPQYIYNPLSNNNFLAPLTVQPYSTYVNFNLDEGQVDYLNRYLKEYSDDLTIVPLKISKYEFPTYYLNVNVYNCTSPILMDSKNIVRCELNTYVKASDGTLGTVILDYISDGISLDPVSLFKKPTSISFQRENGYNIIDCTSSRQKIDLQLAYSVLNDETFTMSHELVDYTDNIYYDSSLTRAEIRQTNFVSNFRFKYRDLEFTEIDSVFYFRDELRFVGSLWDNLYNDK